MEATTANRATAFGNWIETSDPGRALVFHSPVDWSSYSLIIWILLVNFT